MSCCDTWFIMDAADGTGNVIATGAGSIVGTYESTTGAQFLISLILMGSLVSMLVVAVLQAQLGISFCLYVCTCSPPASCPDPSAGTATNITSSSADLGWTAGGTETMWDLEYGVAPYALQEHQQYLV